MCLFIVIVLLLSLSWTRWSLLFGGFWWSYIYIVWTPRLHDINTPNEYVSKQLSKLFVNKWCMVRKISFPSPLPSLNSVCSGDGNISEYKVPSTSSVYYYDISFDSIFLYLPLTQINLSTCPFPKFSSRPY